MFLGHHTTQLKNSNKLPLPAGWRTLMSEGAYLTQGFDQNIMILTPNKFQEIYTCISALNLADPLVRLLSRTFCSTASYVEVTQDTDSISLPPHLMGYANLEDSVVVVGQGEYVEVWSPSQWQQQELEIQNAKANTERFSAFNITTS